MPGASQKLLHKGGSSQGAVDAGIHDLRLQSACSESGRGTESVEQSRLRGNCKRFYAPLGSANEPR
jgi:hypothetical protein